VRVPANGKVAEQQHQVPGLADALIDIRRQGMVIMGLIRKAASILTLGGVSGHSERESEAKAARAQAKAAEAQAGLARAETKVAQEQAAVIARALQEDEEQRHADLEEVAREEAEAVPWSRHPAPGSDV